MAKDTNAPDRRTQILAAAAKVFNEHGFAGATVDEVASQANISKGSVYNYFKSKQDLFVQVFTESFTQDEQEMASHLTEPTTTAGKIDMVFDEWYGRFGKYTQEGALVLEFWLWAARQGDSVLTETFHNLYVRWRERISAIITEGLANGELRADLDPQIAATTIMASMDGLVLQGILGVGLTIDDDFIARLKRGFRSALGLGPAGERPQEAGQ